jgi:HK97 family phage major capsid protein
MKITIAELRAGTWTVEALELQAELRRSTTRDILSRVESENRTTLHASEQRDFDAAQRELTEIEGMIARTIDENRAELDGRIARAQAHEDHQRSAARAAGDPTPGVVRVGAEPLTYSEDPSGPSFFADLVNSQRGDVAAGARLTRHQLEHAHLEQRSVGSGAFAGLVPPQYLTDQFAALARAGSPLRQLVTMLDLPETGMTVNISRITTGTAVAAQATENAAVQNTDADDTLLTANVVTIAGQQDVSLQAIERGVGVDQVLFADLAAAYFTELDRQMLNTDGTGATHVGIRSVASIISVAYTDGTPTVPEFWPKLADAVQQIQSNRFAGPSAIVMHPRRWGWLSAALDTAGRPFIPPGQFAGPQNAAGVGAGAGYGEPVGAVIGGLPVITDANIPTNLGAGTNEDIVIVGRFSDAVLWEDRRFPPALLRNDGPGAGNLTVKLVCAGFSAFTAGRYPKSFATIGGTGLITPTF